MGVCESPLPVMSDLPVLFRERIYLPLAKVKERQLEKEFTKTLYGDRKLCEQCEYQMESPCDMCEQCANFGGTFKLYKHVDIDGDDYVGVPVGSRRKVVQLWPNLRDLEKVDERPSTKLSFRKDFEFLWQLYDYQEEAVAELHRVGYGVLDSPPRSGKTAMFVALCVQLGLKVLILASQRDWLDQFLETFHDATNILDIEKMQGRKLCGIAEKDEDFQSLEICLCTYQSFLSEGNGKKRFNWISHRFGVCGIDECLPGDAEIVLNLAMDRARLIDLINNPDLYPTVLSRNDATGVLEEQPWSLVSRNLRSDLLEIEYEGGVFRCTPEHRIWSNDAMDYVYAKNLREGEDIEILGTHVSGYSPTPAS